MTLATDDRLLDGYRRFRQGVWAARAERYAQLAGRGPRPTTAVIACSDERLDPQAIFDPAIHRRPSTIASDAVAEPR